MITKQTKFIKIVKLDEPFLGKDLYNIFNKKDEVLAGIAWYPAWKKYVAYFRDDTLMDNKCLKTIVEFLEVLNNGG